MSRTFDGVDDKMVTTHDASLAPTAVGTIMLWCNRADEGLVHEYIIDKEINADGLYGIILRPSSFNRADFYVDTSAGLKINSHTGAGDAGVKHIGLWWSDADDTSRSFLNGTGQDASLGGGTPHDTTAEDLWYGLQNQTSGNRFTGDLSNVTLWNVKLSDNEVLVLSRGVNPFVMRNSAQAMNQPLWGNQDPEPDYSGTGNTAAVTTGTTKGPNPPVELLENYL